MEELVAAVSMCDDCACVRCVCLCFSPLGPAIRAAAVAAPLLVYGQAMGQLWHSRVRWKQVQTQRSVPVPFLACNALAPA